MFDHRARCLLAILLVVCGEGCVAASERSQVARTGRAAVVTTGQSRRYELRLGARQGAETEYFVREPRQAGGRLPAVFLLAGLETGRESLDLIDDRDDLILLSMNYPRREQLSLEGLGAVLAPYVLRRMALETLEGGRRALDYLAGRSDVDQDRLILLGVSFGSVVVTALAAQDRRADAVVLIYGGGDLGRLARHNFRERPWWVPGWIVAPAIRLFLGDLEPLDLVGRISPRYVLMVSSRQDEFFPPATARALFEQARDPKKLLWYDTGHLDLLDRHLIRRITREVVSELRAAGYLLPPRPAFRAGASAGREERDDVGGSR